MFSKEIKTQKGLKQGCPLSPTLNAIYISEIEDVLRNGQSGGIVVGKKKIWTLAYADDMVLLALNEPEMKEILLGFEKFAENRDLIVNAEKSKMMIFQRRTENTKTEWSWKNEKIESVTSFKYLGFTFQSNNRKDKHMKEITKKATTVMKKVWGIGERKLGGDFGRRMMIFDYIVKSIMLYGAEI